MRRGPDCVCESLATNTLATNIRDGGDVISSRRCLNQMPGTSMAGGDMTFGELLHQFPDATRRIPPHRDFPITQLKYSAGLDWGSQQGTGKHRHSISIKVVTRGAVLRSESEGFFTTPQLYHGRFCNY